MFRAVFASETTDACWTLYHLGIIVLALVPVTRFAPLDAYQPAGCRGEESKDQIILVKLEKLATTLTATTVTEAE